MRRETKESKTSNDSKATFKLGAVCTVFLIIGFEAALFISRTAVLKIEAGRDHPDTVFVSGAEAAGAGGSPAGASLLPPVVSSSHHSEAVKQVRRESIRRVESFTFNPNSATIEELMRLGFSERQARAIDNYRKKGGRFRRKEDFQKSFVVSDSVYHRLEKYIRIPKIDINKADSAAFDSLPGIGPYFASGMVEFRSRLRGYSYPGQLMDIYKFDSLRFDALKDLITCSEVEPYPLWTLPVEELRSHPYIGGYNEARAIVLLRENTPREDLSVEKIVSAGILPKDKAEKLSRCKIAPPPALSTPP